MKDGKIRIGLIGGGNIAQSAHIPSYLKLKDVKLAGVFDVNAPRAKSVAEKYDMAAHLSLESLLSDDTIDAVSVCTWNNGHAESAIAACKAGKHVLCEKPMAMTVDEALAMEAAAKNSGKIFMMGFVNRFKTQSDIICDMRDKGEFGDIYYARTSNLRRRGTPLGWFTDKAKSGGGPVIDIGVHSIDLTWFLMGKPKPLTVTANTHYAFGDYKTKGVNRWEALDTDDPVFNVEDSASGTITCENGKSINFDVSWAINGEPGMDVILYGNKAGVRFHPLTVYGESAGYLTDNAPVFIDENPFDKEIAHFADCVLTGKTPLATAADGVAVQRILCGIYESSKLNKTVELY